MKPNKQFEYNLRGFCGFVCQEMKNINGDKVIIRISTGNMLEKFISKTIWETVEVKRFFTIEKTAFRDKINHPLNVKHTITNNKRCQKWHSKFQKAFRAPKSVRPRTRMSCFSLVNMAWM